MKFRSEFAVKKLPEPITHRHKLLLTGSCFTENIGEKLETYKFTTLQNPNGILFNPLSVAGALTDYVAARRFTEADLFAYGEAWHSWKHHSRFSGRTAGEALRKINDSLIAAHQFLKGCDYVFITLGSAWVYSLTEDAPTATYGTVAANNHKAPGNWFQRRLANAEEVFAVLENAINQLFQFNPGLKLIFTISPVRHLREGVVENNRSKAALITAVHQLVDRFEKLYYFPAYELVIDDLRDYRFYAEDLVHPNYFATQYVWEKLVDACMNENTKSLMEELYSINLAFRHKPFNAQSKQHQEFLKKFYQKTTALRTQHPHLDLEKEIAYFSQDDSTDERQGT